MFNLNAVGARSRRSKLLRLLLWLGPILFLSLFFFYPLVSILRTSFARTEGGVLTPFLEVLGSASMRGVFWFTIWQALLSTLLTLIVGLPGAYLLARFKFRGRSLLQALTGIPFVMPTLVVAAAFNALLGPSGWLNLGLMELFGFVAPPIRITNTLVAILLAHIFYNTTIVLRMVGDFWSHMDPRLTGASQVLGANRWRTLWHVTVPMLMPAIITAALLVFIFDFTSFGVILVLGGPGFATLEVEIYYQAISLFNLPVAAALSVLQLTCNLALTVAYTRLAARLSRPMHVKPRTYTQRRLTNAPTRWMAVLIIGVMLVLLIAPLMALATRSITRLQPERGQKQAISPGLTLDFYRQLSVNPQQSLFYVKPTTAIGISLVYAVATVVLALVLGLPASWALARDRQSLSSRILDPLLMLPLGTSAVTLGLGFVVALGALPIDLRASPLLVPIAHTLVAFPFVVRSLTPALRSIRPRLRQAAATLGASPRKTMRHIDLPLVGRAVLVAATFAFSISLGEFGATAVISRPEYPTVPVMIYRFLSQPGAMNYGQALALSTILMLVCGGGMLAIERFRIADVGEF
jgi:thiamine transport system permease protein